MTQKRNSIPIKLTSYSSCPCSAGPSLFWTFHIDHTSMCFACTKSLQLWPTLCEPMDYSPPALLSMGCSRLEYWSGSYKHTFYINGTRHWFCDWLLSLFSIMFSRSVYIFSCIKISFYFIGNNIILYEYITFYLPTYFMDII